VGLAGGCGGYASCIRNEAIGVDDDQGSSLSSVLQCGSVAGERCVFGCPSPKIRLRLGVRMRPRPTRLGLVMWNDDAAPRLAGEGVPGFVN